MRCEIGHDLACVRCGRKVSGPHVIGNCGSVGGVDHATVGLPCHAGTALKKLLRSMGFSQSGGCQCEHRSIAMDHNGCEWSEQNIETIVSWLREEAEKRGLPFLDAAGRMLVKRAIANARRASA